MRNESFMAFFGIPIIVTVVLLGGFMQMQNSEPKLELIYAEIEVDDPSKYYVGELIIPIRCVWFHSYNGDKYDNTDNRWCLNLGKGIAVLDTQLLAEGWIPDKKCDLTNHLEDWECEIWLNLFPEDYHGGFIANSRGEYTDGIICIDPLEWDNNCRSNTI